MSSIDPSGGSEAAARGSDVGFDWPTIEWVKVPVNRITGEPNGAAITMRHFSDCGHWFRDEDQNPLGAPPRLATDEEMRRLPVCRSCITVAKAANNPAMGDRPSATMHEDDDLIRGRVIGSSWHLPSTDATAQVVVRREQSYLRSHLLRGRAEAPCALCGRELPASELVAAHIVPRHLLNEGERLDFQATAMLACTLGCDALFERGYVAVDASGCVVGNRATENEALLSVIGTLLGRSVAGHTAATAPRFAQHLALHAPASDGASPPSN